MGTLSEALQSLNLERLAPLDQVGQVDAERLSTRRVADEWSLIEILEHLVVAEREVLQDLPDASELREQRRGLRGRLAYPFVLFVLRRGIMVKVPSPTMVPKGGASLEDLRRMWDENQSWFATYVEGLDESRENPAVFAHPVTGPLTVKATIELACAHFDSHLRDVRKHIPLARSTRP